MKSKVKFVVDIKEDLRVKGYSYVRGTDFRVPSFLKPSMMELLQCSSNLPPDPYCKERTRFRRLSRFIYFPWEDCLSIWPKKGYFQDGMVNKVDGGVTRIFASLTPRMANNEFLMHLIRADFWNLPFTQDDQLFPFDVGVHIVKMEARPGIEAVSSPNCLHKDGEPFTYVHMLQRKDVIGGESVVADNNKNLLFETTLSNPFDSLAVQDSEVYHQVKPIQVSSDKQKGFRIAMLIDFTPMRPFIKQ